MHTARSAYADLCYLLRKSSRDLSGAVELWNVLAAPLVVALARAIRLSSRSLQAARTTLVASSLLTIYSLLFP